MIAELAVGPFVDVAEGFAVANEKETHQPSRSVGSGIAVIMNVHNRQGKIVAAPCGGASRQHGFCGAFPQSVIFLKHESGFGRLYERWGMSRSS
ncbi:hypothetical protein [Rhizobium sp. M1]|uniref:hypothetical protein n=1 Tax=Rhizobium sp. M1 TaxID=2035453 RepID=UPI001596937B|nr:hypothetical protein [Rhizobium sp. M1]